MIKGHDENNFTEIQNAAAADNLELFKKLLSKQVSLANAQWESDKLLDKQSQDYQKALERFSPQPHTDETDSEISEEGYENEEEFEEFEENSSDVESTEELTNDLSSQKTTWHQIDQQLLRILFSLIRANNLNAVSAMIDSKCKLNGTCISDGGGTAIHVAAEAGHSEILKMLLVDGKMKQFINDCEAFDRRATALHWAAICGKTECCKILTEYGINKDQRNNDKYTAMHLSILRGHEDTFRTLLEVGCNPNITNEDGHTCLHMSVGDWKNNTIAKALIGSGKCDIAATDVVGWTALALAVDDDNTEIATLLLENGSPIFYGEEHNTDASDCSQDSDSPPNPSLISIAVKNGNLGIVKALLHYKRDDIDLSARDTEGKTVLEWAKESNTANSVAIIKTLSSHVKRARDE